LLAVINRLQHLSLRKELVSIFVMVFLADVVNGIFSPTFSLYATSLGASLTLVGALGSTVGLTRIVSSVPLGLFSDAKGRKGVLAGGIFLSAMSSYLCTLVSNPYLLLPIRMLTGVATTAIFFIGMAYLGDIVPKEKHGVASGVYTTCMGLGFTLGSELGGRLASQLGYISTYRIAGTLALVGLTIACWGLGSPPKQRVAHARTISPITKLGILTREPHLLAASIGYLLIILMFDAAIVNFFPLYANSMLISQAAIGSMFAIRALASASVRLPTGILTSRFSCERLMVMALVLGMTMVVGISFLKSPVALTLMLMGEGMCFGIFLTSGQAFVTGAFDGSERGTAMGVYSMTGSIASTAGPFLFGAVADIWGLRSVFLLAGALVFLGILVFLYARSRPSPCRLSNAEGEPGATADQ
jgi:MFS family permease